MMIDLRFDIEQEGKSKEVIGQFLCDELFAASQLMLDARDDLEEIVKLYVENGCSLEMVLVAEKDLTRPSPDKLFRLAKQGNKYVLIPSSKAIGIVLEKKLTEQVTLDGLLQLIM